MNVALVFVIILRNLHVFRVKFKTTVFHCHKPVMTAIVTALMMTVMDWILNNVPLIAATLFILHGGRLLIEDWWADRKRRRAYEQAQREWGDQQFRAISERALRQYDKVMERQAERGQWELSHMQGWVEEHRARQSEEENWELRTKDFDRGG